MTQRMDLIIKQIIRNRFDASLSGNSSEKPSRLLNLTRNMGYHDLAEEMAGRLQGHEPATH